MERPKTVTTRYDRAAPLALILVISILCALTWQKWGSVVIDCGRELYVPAAINQGKRLYFDIWYPYGPLIPYWHALLFRVFGVHVLLLETIVIAIVGVTAWLVYSLSRQFLPASLALVAGVALLLQAFEPRDEFNYVLPYSYPATYGAMLSVLLTWLLVRDILDPKPWTWFVAGSIAGLQAITKAEFGLSAYLLLAGALILRALRARSARSILSPIASALPGMMLCVAVYGWYARTSGLGFMFRDNIPVLPGAYFIRAMGSQSARITGSMASVSTIAFCVVSGLLGVLATTAAIRFGSVSRLRGALIMAGAFAVAGFHLALTYASPFQQVRHRYLYVEIAPFFFFNRGMILAAALLLLWTLAAWLRSDREPNGAALLLLLAAGILLGSRTMFRMVPGGYAIFYDSLVFISYLIALRKLAGAAGAPESPRLWTWTAVALCCGLIAVAAAYYPGVHTRSFRITSERGDIYETQATGKAFTEALAFFRGARMRSEKFVVWPEEAALYYFSGATSPSRWLCLTPGILPPGRPTARFLAELEAQKVRYVALSDRDTPEYGVPTFGVDYNQEVYHWLTKNFRVVRTFGDYQRFNPQHWAVQIWERQLSRQPGIAANR